MGEATATELLVPLEAAVGGSHIGGKTAGLHRLAAAGFRIPRTFVVPDAVLQAALVDGEGPQPPRALAQCIARAFAGVDAIIVRSSASDEDGSAASFAGQFRSYLTRSPEDAARAVARCWESLFDPALAEYAARTTGAELTARMSVVVQEWIDPVVSGVSFTVGDVVVTESTFGHGELLVQGLVSPDRYRCETGVVTAKPGQKLLAAVSSDTTDLFPGDLVDDAFVVAVDEESGTAYVELPLDVIERPTLTDEQARAIADAVLRIRDAHGHAVDVEWARAADGVVTFVQVRPSTRELASTAVEPVAGLESMLVVASPGRVEAAAFVAASAREALAAPAGSILITPVTTPEYMPALLRVAGVVAEQGGMLSHTAIVCRELGLPCLVGAVGATAQFATGERVVLDARPDRPTIARAPEIHYVMTPRLRDRLAQRRVRSDLDLLATLPTLEELSVFPDVIDDAPGVGVPVGVSFRTGGPDALVLPNGVTDANDGYRLVRLHAEPERLERNAQRVLEALDTLRTPSRTLSEREALRLLHVGLGGKAERVWNGGQAPVDDPVVVGEEALLTLRHTFGSFGRYGHFAELLAGPDDDVLLVIHGGAMEVSDIVYWQAYFELAAEAARLGAVSDEHFVRGLFGVPRSHPAAARFIEATNAVTNVAYAWRAAVHERICAVLNVEGDLLSDLPHNRLETNDDGVLHAKGVQPLPEDGLAIICGGFGVQSYLIRGAGRAQLGCSHGGAHEHRIAPLTPEVARGLRSPLAPHATNRPENVPIGLRLRLAAQNAVETMSGLREHEVIEQVALLRPLVNFSGAAKPRLRWDLPGAQIMRELVVATPLVDVTTSAEGRC